MRRRVLLDEFHVQVFAPAKLPAKKARKVRHLVRSVLRNAGTLIEHFAPAKVHTKPGDIVVRTES